jgi:hypothetical protein
MAPITHPFSPGQRFGRWTILDPSDREAVLCRCDCGTERAVKAYNLFNKTKGSRSCGCLRREKAREQFLTHGLGYDDYRYTLWRHIMGRCYQPSHQNYSQYGGRGIKVHLAWHDPAVFCREISELIGPRPKGHSLDRIDNDGDYKPGNVEWKTRIGQARNRRTNVLLTCNGETLTIAEWTERTGLGPGVIWMRINRYGWSHERAITTPARAYARRSP